MGAENGEARSKTIACGIGNAGAPLAGARRAGSSNCDWCCVSARAESVLRLRHIE
jgi:hypothetical protein